MASFNAIYLPCVVITAAIFAVLSFLGPPLPVTRDTNIPEQALTWQIQLNNDSYGGWNDESDQLWDTIVPNNGVVLATNLTSGFHFWANVAMFHQLKCLRDIRSRLIALAGSWDEVEAFTAWRGPGSEYERIGSCFDYVRQVCRCLPDRPHVPLSTVSPLANTLHRESFATPIQPYTPKQLFPKNAL